MTLIDPDEDIMDRIVEGTPSPDPMLPDTVRTPIELFESLTVDEQDEVLRLIIRQDGFGRLAKLVQNTDTPGAMDLFLDRVKYFHFLPLVRDEGLRKK